MDANNMNGAVQDLEIGERASHQTRRQKTLNFLDWCRENALLFFTLAGVICGSAAGSILRCYMDLSDEAILCLSYPGEIFMRILKLIILPLIITSIVSCCATLNAKLSGKIAIRTFLYFILTSFFNACLGVALASLIQPGRTEKSHFVDSDALARLEQPVSTLDAFLDIGRNIFPDNVFEALFTQTYSVYVPEQTPRISVLNDTFRYTRTLAKRNGTNNIGVIVLCLIFGTVLGTIDTPGSRILVEIFRTSNQVVMKIIIGVMWLTPIGICSVICGKILTVDDISVVVSQLGWFVLTVIFGVLLYQLFFMQMIYFVFVRKNPYAYYWGLFPGMLTAFATASTAAALPVTFKCMDKKLKMNQKISRFVLTIGCSINMDGTALFLAVASVFIAQLNNFSLDSGRIVTLVLVCTAASMSSASVPSAALVLMLMVLNSIGLANDDVSLLFAIDWLVDRCRTTNNMLGDCYASAVVEHLSEKELIVMSKPDSLLVDHKSPSSEQQKTIRNSNNISSPLLIQ